MKNEIPAARFENIIVQELSDEVLICDTLNNRMFCLNKTAAEVWKLADGTRTAKEISQQLGKILQANVSEELVSFALVELSRENLLIERISMSENFQNLSRREAIRRVGLASMIALPLISSLATPTAARAASVCTADENDEFPDGCACDPANQGFDCQSRCCASGVCSDSSQCACTLDADCPPGQTCCPNGTCRTRCPV